MKKLQLFFCYIAILIFAGCSKKNKIAKKIETQLPKDQLLKKEKLNYQQLLALHHEIPDTLLGFDVVYIRQDQVDKQAIEVVYKPIKNKVITQQDIKKSYIADMEMLGWKMIGEFDSENIQLIFQKAGAKLLSTVIIQHDLYIKVIVCTKK
jgi:hypothetical protein